MTIRVPLVVGLMLAGGLLGIAPARGANEFKTYIWTPFNYVQCSAYSQGVNDGDWNNEGCSDRTTRRANSARPSSTRLDNVNLFRHIGFRDRIACVHAGEFETATSDNGNQVSSHAWVANC